MTQLATIVTPCQRLTRPASSGVYIASGVAYGAVATCPAEVLFDDPLERLELAPALAGAEQLSDFAGRFKQELRRIKPAAVAVLHVRLYAQWKYADAFKRVSIEAAIMLAVEELSTPGEPIEYVSLKQEKMAAAVGIPLKNFTERARQEWGAQIPRYANERVYAIAAALSLAQERCS